MDYKKLRLLRMGKGWTQGEMADRVGIARSYYNSIERGKMLAGMGTLLKIAEVLGIKLKSLLKK